MERFRRYTHRWFHRWKCHVTVWISQFESLSHSLVKLSEKNLRHHTVTTFQKTCMVRRWYGRYIPTNVFHWYIPTVSPMYSLCRYIPTDVEIELCSSVKTTDEKILLVSLLVFTDFLVVFLTHPLKWKPFGLETCTSPHHIMLNFYQINGDGEIWTRDHLVIKALIPCQRTNST